MTLCFAHIADCHVGSWRDPTMRALNMQYFSDVIDAIIAEKVDVLLVAGDLFNTAMPSVDALKLVTEKFKEVHDAGIKILGVSGSHDYSATGKSMLEVLEKAGLFTNVLQGSVDEHGTLSLTPTVYKGYNFVGLMGKRGGLEKAYYEALSYTAEKPTIFIFHSAILEFLPKAFAEMDALSLSTFPKNCVYYAGGHVHYRFLKHEDSYGTFCFPGPVFPNSYGELLDLKASSYVLGSIDDTGTVTARHIEIPIPFIHQEINVTGMIPQDVQFDIEDPKDKIVMLTLRGKLDGSLSDIPFTSIIKHLQERGALCVLKNTAGVSFADFEAVTFDMHAVSDIEDAIITEHIGQSTLKGKDLSTFSLDIQKKMVKDMMHLCFTEKKDGETKVDYEKRILDDFEKLVE